MDGIQQQIKRLRDKNTRYCEERSSCGSQPGIANLPCDAEIVLPVGRQSGHIDLFTRDRIRDVNFQESIPFRQILHIGLEMDKDFQERSRWIGSTIDNGPTTHMPALGSPQTTTTVKTAVITDSPQDQLRRHAIIDLV